MDHQGDVGQLVEMGHPEFAPPIVFVQHEAVVGGQHDGGVAPHVMGIEVIQKPSKLFVAERHQRHVVCTHFGNFLGRVV